MELLYARQEVSYEIIGHPETVGVTAVLVVAFLFVGLRFWSRYLTTASYGLDDLLLVAGLVRGTRITIYTLYLLSIFIGVTFRNYSVVLLSYIAPPPMDLSRCLSTHVLLSCRTWLGTTRIHCSP
jgi:hypothetical protein